MKTNKLVAALLSISMTIPTIATSFASATDSGNLIKYQTIVSDFNKEYGTAYQVATPAQLEKIGDSIENVTAYFSTMTEDEFWDYLYEAYSLDLADNSFDDAIEVTESTMDETNLIGFDNFIGGDAPLSSGTQKYYYRGSSTEYFYITATWNYGAGYYHYTGLQSIGAAHTEGYYPYFSPYNSSHYTQNSASEMVCHYYCDKYVSYGITDLTNWDITVTYTAGAGDMWQPISA